MAGYGAAALVASSLAAGGLAAGASSKGSGGPTSIVQLGDSVAAGEGTLYGFTFNTSTGEWSSAANPNPAWNGPYPDCHQSKYASVNIIAQRYPKAKVTQLACTGSTFLQGVAGPWSDAVPAQFGNWATRQLLNPRYSAAKPDLVLVSLGANDVQFVSIVAQCAAAFIFHPSPPVQCTAQQPSGPDDVITKSYTDQIPTLDAHLTQLVGWIQARADSLSGKGAGSRVRIVFTTYPDMLPTNGPAGGKDLCPDTFVLSNDQLKFLSGRVRQLDSNIVSTIDGYAKKHQDRNVTAVNLANAYQGHLWCAKNAKTRAYTTPWAYGLSVYRGLTSLVNVNPAPFHPTPDGQRAIASKVAPVVAKLFSGSR